MTLRLVVLLLAALGVGMFVFGVIAYRDEPPRWMLRFKHPGRFILLGPALVVAAIVLNSFRFSMEEELKTDTGQEASCSTVGPLVIQGEERQVYACTSSQTDGSHIGCYAMIDGRATEVTLQAQRPGAFPEKPDC